MKEFQVTKNQRQHCAEHQSKQTSENRSTIARERERKKDKHQNNGKASTRKDDINRIENAKKRKTKN